MKVSIIGATGRVGRAAAFCLAEENSVGKLVLFAREESLCKIEGESLDIYDALAAKGIYVSIKTTCDLKDIEDSNVVVLSAGISRKAGEEREDLGVQNAKIVAEYAKKVAEIAPDAIILVITNPVDVMTYVALKASGFKKNKVFGLGNHLDSLRFKTYIAKHFHVHVSEIHTRIVGQHGPQMVPLISSTSIGGIPIEYYSAWDYFTGYEPFDIKKTIEKVKNAGSNIIGKKGATEYGPAFAISNIVTTILNNENKILTVSAYLDRDIEGIEDVCLGVPVKLGIDGIKGILPIKMSESERESFLKAAEIVKKDTDKLMKVLK
ncbi:MAG: malate dehydrogenase [Methanobacterium sp.]|uniref:malate dehydrogenase n=1 Tax=Methanobacterium sp. TaxID=2164 RepID=UPI003D65A1B4|nr:malate dehydrogenase [Methanobacterium sp.]